MGHVNGWVGYPVVAEAGHLNGWEWIPSCGGGGPHKSRKLYPVVVEMGLGGDFQ